MCSRKNCTIGSPVVHQYALAQPGNFLKLSNSGYKCKKNVVLNVLLLAATAMTSIYAICKKLTLTPTGHAIIDTLKKSFPDIDALEQQINQGLCPYGKAYKSLKRKARKIAIDLTLRPYHGQPLEDEHETFRSQPKSGTTHFHAYATAYITDEAHRYNVAMTFVRGNEKMDVVVKRLMQRVRKLNVKTKYLLLDRSFFSVKVIRYLKNSRTPFLIPVVMRDRKKKNSKAKEMLQWIEQVAEQILHDGKPYTVDTSRPTNPTKQEAIKSTNFQLLRVSLIRFFCGVSLVSWHRAINM